MVRCALLIIVLLLAVLVVVGYFVGGRPSVVYSSPATILAVHSDGEALLLLARSDAKGTGGSLYALPLGSSRSQALYARDRLTEILPAGDRVLALESDGPSANLIAIPRRGATPFALATDLRRPAGLAADEESVYWTESVPAIAPHVWHVPALQPRILLRSCSLTGRGGVRTLAAAEGSGNQLDGEILGLHGGRLYWLQRFGKLHGDGWSAIRSAPAHGGIVTTHVLERGPQAAMLRGEALYWSGPSEDAGDPLQFRCVRHAALPHLSPHTLTDWLAWGGSFFWVGGQLYYAAYDGVWAVPGRLGRPRQLEGAAGGPLSAGLGGSVYGVVTLKNGDHALLRRPVTLTARLRAAMRLPQGSWTSAGRSAP